MQMMRIGEVFFGFVNISISSTMYRFLFINNFEVILDKTILSFTIE